jgi:pyruvate-formate lyase-activating enzyme
MGIEAVQWTGGGSVLVHPDYKELFRYSLSLGLENALVTNGQHFDEETAEICKNFAWVRFSIDSGDSKTYKNIRGVDVFDRVWKNIKYFTSINKKCIVGVGFVVTKENFLQSHKCAVLAKEAGVDNFRVSGVFTPELYKYFNGFREDATKVAKMCEELNDENFTVFNLFTERLSDTFKGKPKYDNCPMKDLVCYIGADLNVYYCCVLAFNESGLIGSLENQTFEELWQSEEKKKKFKNHNPSRDCGIVCMFNFKNDFINYCIKESPEHVNFL